MDQTQERVEATNKIGARSTEEGQGPLETQAEKGALTNEMVDATPR